MSQHLSDHFKYHELTTDNVLHVVSMISNPIRFNSRLRLFRDFASEMEKTPHVRFYIVEVAFGDRQFEVTQANNPQHLQLRTTQEIWHKENAINLAVKRLLPISWKYVATLDGDISFLNRHWALETIQQLQHYPVIQPWSDCIDRGPYGETLQHFQSFGYIHRLGIPKQTHPNQPYKYAHSGFAWAYTRYFWENVSGLMDYCILGSADHHQAFGLIGRMQDSVHGSTTKGFKERCYSWQNNACKVTHGNDVGFVKGTISHAFHGKKSNRKYRERWKIQIDHEYDPNVDVAYDSQGLVYVLNKPKLLADLRDYFRVRQEDSIDAY